MSIFEGRIDHYLNTSFRAIEYLKRDWKNMSKVHLNITLKIASRKIMDIIKILND